MKIQVLLCVATFFSCKPGKCEDDESGYEYLQVLFRDEDKGIKDAVKTCEAELLELCKNVTCPAFCNTLLSTSLQETCKKGCNELKRCAIKIPHLGSTGSADELLEEQKQEKEQGRSAENIAADLDRRNFFDNISNEILDSQNREQLIRCIAQERDVFQKKSGRDGIYWQAFETESYRKLTSGETRINTDSTYSGYTNTLTPGTGTNAVKKCEDEVIQHCLDVSCPLLCGAFDQDEKLRTECLSQCTRDGQCALQHETANSRKFLFDALDLQNNKQLIKCISEAKGSNGGDKWKKFEVPEYTKACKKQSSLGTSAI